MKIIVVGFLLFVLCFSAAYSQEAQAYRKNAIAFNFGRALVDELNISVEHFISFRKSIEVNFGLIYVNTPLKNIIKDWSTSTFLFERGYAGRIGLRIYKRQTDPNSNWKDYVCPVLSYRYLYYDAQWFE